MSVFRPWAMWRRIQYGLAFLLLWVSVGGAVFLLYFYTPANCFDGIVNGSERGIDCGGRCVRICAADVLPPQVVWAESFASTPGQYNAVAYVENPNQVAATPVMKYVFSLYDEDELVVEQSGKTVLPPNSVYPIFEGRLSVPTDRTITRTELTLLSADLWVPASVGRDQFRTVDINLRNADTEPRLLATINNTKVTDAENVQVVATIFNELGKPVTASQTFIETMPARSDQDVVFTWPEPITRTVRSCIISSDVALLIDMSGSMNNDNEDPPQPVTDALAAASQFVGTLRETDQAAVVTFATEAELVSALSGTHAVTASTITDLAIAPEAESGYTNLVDALKLGNNELNSTRHSDDARRALIVLTDGLPTTADTRDVVSEAKQSAAALAAAGVDVYAIGLGDQVDRGFLSSIASTPDRAYFAATSNNLATIYSQITSALCESGPTKIEIIAKTETNFTPLR